MAKTKKSRDGSTPDTGSAKPKQVKQSSGNGVADVSARKKERRVRERNIERIEGEPCSETADGRHVIYRESVRSDEGYVDDETFGVEVTCSECGAYGYVSFSDFAVFWEEP